MINGVTELLTPVTAFLPEKRVIKVNENVTLGDELHKQYPELCDAISYPEISITAKAGGEKLRLCAYSSCVEASTTITFPFKAPYYRQLSNEKEVLEQLRRGSEFITFKYTTNFSEIAYFLSVISMPPGSAGKITPELVRDAIRRRKEIILERELYDHFKWKRRHLFGKVFTKVGIPYNIPFSTKIDRFIKGYAFKHLDKITLTGNVSIKEDIQKFVESIVSSMNVTAHILDL